MKMLRLILVVWVMQTSIAFCETDTIVCKFDRYCSDDGMYRVEEDFVVAILVDYEKNTAYIIDNQNRTEVMMVRSIMGGISFVETTESRNVRVTTIDENGSAVHSRNTIIMGRLAPVQFYGIYLIR